MQELGKILKQSSEEKRKVVFEGEEVPRGEDVTRTLYIEGEGMIIRLQKRGNKAFGSL
ncbi:MAG: hypothetical protein PWQ34_1953 [Caldanaerobacter sp.]|uniref:Uncharacterized protein n=2 Tax=Thermoanaerobacteraceae TaxID=186814 RepID=A0A0F5PMI9_9THEO|nr:hypothetical protein CDSM653_01077 [Caldanaerobacter subterraneus subsp. pacificus DSM 12653]MDI3519806.1 hypothetical protein [Caldanaerobacter sp.]